MLKSEREALMLLLVIVTSDFLLVLSGDPFESLFVRINCYGDEQKGCDRELTDVYPEVAWSCTNLTKATTHFYLFTKDNVDQPELLHKCGANVPPNSKFNRHCRTEIFIPGFLSGICNFAIFRELKNERLKCGCYNVILVDWMWGNSLGAVEAKLNMKIDCSKTNCHSDKKFERRYDERDLFLQEKYDLDKDDFILTGHNLGAHGAGLVGQIEPIGIIMGLDPAGILYSENTPLDERLDATDAKCVHVMHCNAGQCFPVYYGVNFTCGTIDAWFNDGLNQLSCYPQLLISLLKGDYEYGAASLIPGTCSHVQCLQYYKASMCPTDDNHFLGVKCRNIEDFQSGKCKHCGHRGRQCAVIGAYACDCLAERSEKHGNMDYYLKTKLFCPFYDSSSVHKGQYTCQAASHQIQNS